MRIRLITATVLVAMPLTLATSRGASPQEEATANRACQDIIAIVLSHAQHAQDPHRLAELKFKCEHHPKPGACASMAKFLAESSPIHALHCADGSRTAEPSALTPIDPKVAAADDACHMFAYAYQVHAENLDKDHQVSQWKATSSVEGHMREHGQVHRSEQALAFAGDHLPGSRPLIRRRCDWTRL